MTPNSVPTTKADCETLSNSGIENLAEYLHGCRDRYRDPQKNKSELTAISAATVVNGIREISYDCLMSYMGSLEANSSYFKDLFLGLISKPFVKIEYTTLTFLFRAHYGIYHAISG